MESSWPNSITVYLVRHGETKSNAERMFSAPTINLLSEKGQNQAKQLGMQLTNVKFTAVYSSTYQRAFDTAKIVLEQSNVCKELTGKIQQDDRIREYGLGIFEGTPVKKIIEEVMKTKKSVREFIVPAGETKSDIHLRTNSFLKEVFNNALEKNNAENEQILLIVSHSLTISIFMHYLNEAEAKNHYKVIGCEKNCERVMANTAYMKLEVTKETDGKFQLKFVKIHEKSHLANEVEDPGNVALIKFLKENPDARHLTDCIPV